jgi:MATE family multidrug resistance protein
MERPSPSAARVAHDVPSELSALSRLAAPLVVSHAGNQLMGLVDTLMVGRLGKVALGGVGIGNAWFFTITLVAMGCVLGADAPTSQALGAGEAARARRVLWQGLRVALGVSVPALVLIALVPLILAPVGVDRATAAEASRYLWARLPSVVPFLLFAACRTYLQNLGATRPIVVAMIAANVLNVIGNALLIFGDDALTCAGLPAIGLPALGVVGAALSTVIASIAQAVVLALAVRAIEPPPDPDRRRADPATIRTIFALGVPIGLQMLAEMGVFNLASTIAGTMSADAAAGHQVAITMASFTFMFALGTGAATATRVGWAVGAGDHRAARRAGFVGIGLGTSLMAAGGLAFLVAPWTLARAFSDDLDVVRAAVPLVQIAAVFQISDGIQGVAAGALRGAGDPRVPLIANIVGHYGVGLPVSILLGIVLGLGAPGLWWGLSAGLTAVAAGLVARFWVLSGRPMRRV